MASICTDMWSGMGRLLKRDFERPSLRRVASWLLIFVVALAGGMAWNLFRLPGAKALDQAFIGGKAFMERGVLPDGQEGASASDLSVTSDHPEKTLDGFTLITQTNTATAQIFDMEGRSVHRWTLPFSKAIPNSSRRDPLDDGLVHWFCCHLYANGDLLGVYQTEADTPPGYGLAKLDKDSNLLWRYDNQVHHSVDVGEDGKIYTLTNKIAKEAPTGLEAIGVPFIDEYLVVLSPQGQELASINLLEAYRDSPFALTLSMIDVLSTRRPKTKAQPAMRRQTHGDILHSNSIRVLNPSMAPKFPMFQAHQVLVSMRSINTIAMVDLEKRAVTWSAQGLWNSQHCPEFLENGRLLIYDNAGSNWATRVLEYDPQTRAVPWSYAGENGTSFVASSRGMAQRLANGNTLIVDPDHLQILEVTKSKELAWAMGSEGRVGRITSARRYAPGELSFLKGVPARPSAH